MRNAGRRLREMLPSVAWFLVGCQLLSVASAGGSGSALAGFQLSLYSYYDTVTSAGYSEPLAKFLHSTGCADRALFFCCDCTFCWLTELAVLAGFTYTTRAIIAAQRW